MHGATQTLIHSIKTFANIGSNPVLAILPENGIVELNRRYPDPVLSFGHAGIRAYYHCHTAAGRPESEHGHFHIFLRYGDSWSHLAGLSMDIEGQPLQWFAVNHWVTGESWSDAEDLLAQLDALHLEANTSLTEQWLFAMLKFYRSGLEHLLQARDQVIEGHTAERQREAVLRERSIYLLSDFRINLLQDIALSLAPSLMDKG